jgi:serine protease Do
MTMKTKPYRLLVAATAALLTAAQAQEPPRPPGAPPSPAPPAVPHPPHAHQPPGGGGHPFAPNPPLPPASGQPFTMPLPPQGPREGAGPHHERRGHDRRDEGRRDEGRREHREAPGRDRAEAPREPQPFLGVVTSPAPTVLSAQLGLPEGFGLVVQDVLPGSPAATAGVQKNDVLKALNDQQLLDPGQLATLVRSHGKDKEVMLTVLRKGQEQQLSVRIGERLASARRPGPGAFFPLSPERREDMERLQQEFKERAERAGRVVRDRSEKLRDQAEALGRGARERAEKAREQAERARRELEDRMRRMREGKGGSTDPGAAAPPPADILREARPGGGGEIKAYSESSVATWDGARSRLQLKDADGEIEVATDNGRRTLRAKNPQGEVVFSGPVDTEEQRKAVPEQFRRKLDQIQIQPGQAQGRQPPTPPQPNAPRDGEPEREVQ